MMPTKGMHEIADDAEGLCGSQERDLWRIGAEICERLDRLILLMEEKR